MRRAPGTTTATVLARAIYDESCKSAAAGIAPQDMRKGVQLGVDHVVARLKERAKMISTPEEIAQVPAEPPGASVLASLCEPCHIVTTEQEPLIGICWKQSKQADLHAQGDHANA